MRAWLWSHVPSYPGAELCNADGSPLPSTTPLALAQTHPAGNGSITRARESEAGCRDGPQGRRVLGKGRPVLLPQATRPPASRRNAGQASPLPTSAPAPHEAAAILTCHLNEKGERVEVQEEEEDVLILFSLPVSPHEISNDSGHKVPFSKILADLRAGSRVGS